jgi:hypothetical protein
VLGLLRRPDGASLKELMKVTAGWRILSVGTSAARSPSGWGSSSCRPRTRTGSAATPSKARFAQSI